MMEEEQMTLQRAVDWVHGARYPGQKNGLENMRALLRTLGNPQDGLRFLHVAGTNGKGSVCAFLERALRECGYKTGLYTSPYLCEYAERVRVNGVPLDDEMLLRLILRVKRAAEDLVARGECFPTTFELGTAIAFLAFAEAKTDWAVIEVGLGGRLDSTNVIAPRACAISAIGMDHMKTLGDTLEAIAREKAGILKHGVPAAIHPANGSVLPVLESAARACGAPLDVVEEPEILAESAHGARFRFRGETYEISLAGRHQVGNAALALAALGLVGGLDFAAVRAGLAKTRWHCRLEWVDGVLIDGAHNPQGAAVLAEYLRAHVPGRRVLLVGMMHDKQVEACAKLLAPVASRVIATRVDDPRAASAEEVAAAYPGAQAVDSLEDALALARADGGTVIACGSLYLAGAVRSLLRPGERLCL